MSTLAEAIRYALSRWTGLSLFLDDGRVEINSNVVERSIRPLARVFAGSGRGRFADRKLASSPRSSRKPTSQT